MIFENGKTKKDTPSADVNIPSADKVVRAGEKTKKEEGIRTRYLVMEYELGSQFRAAMISNEQAERMEYLRKTIWLKIDEAVKMITEKYGEKGFIKADYSDKKTRKEIEDITKAAREDGVEVRFEVERIVNLKRISKNKPIFELLREIKQMRDELSSIKETSISQCKQFEILEDNARGYITMGGILSVSDMDRLIRQNRIKEVPYGTDLF